MNVKDSVGVVGTAITLVGGLGGALATGDALSALYCVGFLALGAIAGLVVLPLLTLGLFSVLRLRHRSVAELEGAPVWRGLRRFHGWTSAHADEVADVGLTLGALIAFAGLLLGGGAGWFDFDKTASHITFVHWVGAGAIVIIGLDLFVRYFERKEEQKERPDCISLVHCRARKCQFCGYEFRTQSGEDSTTRSN